MGVARKELIAASMLACRAQLEAAGFTRHAADRFFTMPLGPRLFGWIGLGRAVHRGDGSMVIIPAVGLLHQDVERLWTTCAGIPYHRYAPATVQMSPGRLTPEGVATPNWVFFRPGESVDEAAKQVCRPIVEYGLPWMREHASLTGIQALDGSEQYHIRLLTWRRAVIAYLLGDPDRARQVLSDALNRIEQEGGPHADEVLAVERRFAAALEQRMSEGPWRP